MHASSPGLAINTLASHHLKNVANVLSRKKIGVLQGKAELFVGLFAFVYAASAFFDVCWWKKSAFMVYREIITINKKLNSKTDIGLISAVKVNNNYSELF